MIYNIFFIALLSGAFFCAWQISVADFRRRIIPDVYLFPLLVIGLIITNFFPWPTSSIDGAIGAAFGYTMAAIIGVIFDYKLQKKDKTSVPPIGMGDIKLIATGGIWLGTTGLSIALVFACILGIIWGVRKKQQYIPFGPFFIAGGILSLITTGLFVII